MTDAEQIEAWRSDFEKWCKSYGHNTELYQGEYLNFNTCKAWIVWVAAKRSQPVIELPKDCHDDQSTLFRNGFMSALKAVKNQLTAAGYKYKVKE